MNARFTAGDRSLSLGEAGAKLEAALLALEMFEARHPRPQPGSDPQREHGLLLQAAADRLWQFVVQREACGLLDHGWIDAHFAVPAAVWLRCGIRPRRTRREPAQGRSRGAC